MKKPKRLTLPALALALAFTQAAPAFAAAPQPCQAISGVLSTNAVITLTDDCVITVPVTVAAVVTLRSGGGRGDAAAVHTLTRGVAGNLISVAAGALLTLENVVIDGGRHDVWPDGGGTLVFVDNRGSLIMNAGAVLRNNVAAQGGGAVVGNTGVFTMNGGEIRGNVSDMGGGVFMRYGGIFNMFGGVIADNAANDFGGGVFVNDAGGFFMSGGRISGNGAGGVGGGVNVWGGKFLRTGGVICGNTAAEGYGVFVYDGVSFGDAVGCDVNVACADRVDVDLSPDAGGVASSRRSAARAPLGHFSVAPNPVPRSSGSVAFYYDGGFVRGGNLKIYDVTGQQVNRIAIPARRGAARGVSVGESVESEERLARQVGAWDLRDRRGRLVSEGTYLVHGEIVVNGRRERVSAVLGIGR
jgi:hypothetical protein